MKIKNLSIKLALICPLFAIFAFIPKADDPIDRLVAALQKWTETNPQEKVYLHTDKPYYAIGDTIWFKGYITVGGRHQLSALSGALYVDLINEKDSVMRALKLPVVAGTVMGDFALGDELREGSYRVRAYTQWMRNAGEEYFYDKTFTVGNLVTNNVVVKANYEYKQASNDKPQLAATLNYTDDNGAPLADKEVQYAIVIDRRVVWTKTLKTDSKGNILVNINNDKNANLAGAYIRTIIEGADKKKITRDFPIKADLSQGDVQFFPESGSLVNGITSRVGFKAVGIDDTGLPIKGNVTDNDNKDVALIQTLHAGMGNFLIRPEAGKTYTAKVTFEDGTVKSITLPKAVDEGFVLGVYQPNKDSILVRISASANMTSQSLNFIAQAGGETIIATPVKIAGPTTAIWLEKKTFPSGIAQFTLFNNAGEPLNERIAFIRSNDNMQLGIKTAKATYKSKEAVTIALDAKSSQGKPSIGNFSVAVIDINKVPIDETVEGTIFTNILLTADLKGYIEKPNYYFINQTDEVNRALDNLMLTQGYRRFAWKDITGNTVAKPVFEAEGLGYKVSGTVVSLGGKAVPNAVVTMVSLKAQLMKRDTTGPDGRFVFDKIFLTDSIKFAIQAVTAKNGNKVEVHLDKIPRLTVSKNRNLADVTTNITGTLKAYIDNAKKQDELYEKTGQLDKVQRLKQVTVTGKKAAAAADANISTQGMFKIPAGSADQTITFGPEAEACLTLAMCLRGKLQGIGLETNTFGYTTVMDYREKAALGLILNGRRITNPDEVSEILDGSVLPQDVARIEIVRSNRAMVDFLGGPAIMILTKKGYATKDNDPNVSNISPKGFNKVRQFYSPKYDKPSDADKLPDLRSTVYWNPDVKTNLTGKTAFRFFNTDGPGTYKVIIEGINAEGEIGRQVYTYQVEK